MSELKGISYLRNKLENKKTRVLKRYDYYEMKYAAKDLDISTPPNLRNFKAVLGWCEKSVDCLADRLQFEEFENDNFNMNEIFKSNNADTFFDSAMLSALISSCCFVYISKDEQGYPRLQVIDGANATGIIDPITGLLTEGYAVLQTDTYGTAIKEAYFTNEYTEFYEKGEKPYQIQHDAGYPLLVPIIYKPDAVRPFGRSRISRACMSYVDSASRTVKRSEISAEFYSFPQKYAVGLSEDSQPLEKWKASMSSMITFTKDEDGDSPKLGQFTQQSMTPHNEQLKMFASLFAGETGLTMEDLGFVSSNPSSVESIKASHENLKLMCRKAQRDFASCFLNVGMVAVNLRDGMKYTREVFKEVKAVWSPIFEPDASMLSSIGDGILKVNQAVPEYFGKDNIKKLTGIESD